MAETFGKTDKGGTEESKSADWIRGTLYQSGSAGTLASISLYVKQYGAQTPNIKCAIYDASRNLLANGGTEAKIVPAAQDGWMVFNFPVSPTVLATTNYYLCFWIDDWNIYAYRNGGTCTYDSETYDGWPATLSGEYEPDEGWSIYATYEEAPPPNEAPTAPTGLQVDGKSAPTGVNCISDLTPGFSAIYNDPDAGDTSNAIQIQVGTASGLSDMWDSGWLADATVTPNRCTAKTYAGTALSAGTSYWWRCRFRDEHDLEGAWSDWQQFDMCAVVPPVPPGIGLQCIPGGPLPHRRPFTLAVRMPKEEPSFLYEYPLPNLLGG